jgi:RNA polymerase sigma-70 factor (ECF subfamily)
MTSQSSKTERDGKSDVVGQGQVNHLVEHLFRHQAGQITSTLTRFFGIDNLDMVEDVVQETLLKALQQWVFRGVPDNPAGWILQTAKNRAVDVLRRQTTFRNKQQDIVEQIEQELSPNAAHTEIYLAGELRDDQLRMMFTCCHPVLTRESRVALTLKTLCGFSVAEIARAFLAQEVTIAQRVVRAKRKIRQAKIPFQVPGSSEIAIRLSSVLEVLYLFFNEGYSAHAGENLVRQDLCFEAIRLTSLLADFLERKFPRVHALLALMLLQASRLPSRVDAKENLLLLREQDRSLWDQEMIHLGLEHLELSAEGEELSDYHLQAGIAACHVVADDYESTDWTRILSFYDQLTSINHSPVIALNRAVAVSMVDGPAAALEAIDKIKSLPPMKNYFLLPATRAELCVQIGDLQSARDAYQQALELVGTDPERRFLLRKLKECEND